MSEVSRRINRPEAHPLEKAPLHMASTFTWDTPRGFDPMGSNGHFRGLVTGITGSAPDGGVEVKKHQTHRGQEQSIQLGMEAVVAADVLHDELAQLAGIQERDCTFPFLCEGEEIGISIRYKRIPTSYYVGDNRLTLMDFTLSVAYVEDYRGLPGFNATHEAIMATLYRDVVSKTLAQQFGVWVSHKEGVETWKPTQNTRDILRRAQ
jgi:hypothetical protein